MSKKKKSLDEMLEDALVPEDEQPYDIPENWEWVKIGGITDVVSGGTPKTQIKEYYENGEIAWISPADLSGYEEKYISYGKKNITQLGLEKSSAKLMPKKTVLLSTRAPIGYVVIANNELSTNQGFKSFLPNESYLPEYLYWYLKNSKGYLESMASGTTFKELSGSKAKEISFPLAPIKEQERIARKIEILFAKLDEAKQLIEEAKKAFEIRKNSILSLAVNGELSAKWRRETAHQKRVEEELLQLVEIRKRRYAEECISAKQKAEKKPRKKFVEIIESKDIDKDLPDSWLITNINSLAYVTKLAGFEYTNYVKPSDTGDVPLIRAQNVQMGRFVNKNIQYISEDVSNVLERSKVKYNDLLMVFIGAGTGNVCIAPNKSEEEVWNLSPNVAKIETDWLDTKYLCYYLQSLEGRTFVNNKMKATAQPSLSMETIREVEVFLPPLEEQREVVKILDSYFEKENIIINSLPSIDDIEKLKNSILTKAFKGELGTNDPTDEPAIELLKSILQEKL